MSKELFKKIPVDMREHLHELTGNELKVWLYLYLRTGKEGTAFPSNQTIADAIDLNRETVKIAKTGLRKKGWSLKVMQRRREDGSLSTVMEKTIMPWLPFPTAVAEKASHGTVAGKAGGGESLPTEGTYNKPVEGTVSPIQGEPEGRYNNINPVVVLSSGSSEEKDLGLVAGYSPDQIAQHIAKFPEGSWVWQNATADALQRPGFVEHVMSLDPPKKSRCNGTPATNGKDKPAYHNMKPPAGRDWFDKGTD